MSLCILSVSESWHFATPPRKCSRSSLKRLMSIASLASEGPVVLCWGFGLFPWEWLLMGEWFVVEGFCSVINIAARWSSTCKSKVSM